jgi:N utilization substance protein A
MLPPSEQVASERVRMGQRLRVYLVEVNRALKGPMLLVSRGHRNFVRRLMELEIPEIYNGVVEIRAIAREAGSRSKVAVHSRQSGLDPVGACVGQRGMRIQNIVNELGGERIDIIQYQDDPAKFVASALSPARVISVSIDEASKTATVIVPESQLSLAIGKEGQNARLAAKLTGWRVDIKSDAAPRETVQSAVPEPAEPPEPSELGESADGAAEPVGAELSAAAPATAG